MQLFRRRPDAPVASFTHRGRRLSYHEHGRGSRVIVMTHGLLMDNRMYTRLAADAGRRRPSRDRARHARPRRLRSAARHDGVLDAAVRRGRDRAPDHLDLAQAVIGGTSLGANVSLESAVAAPDRVRGLVLEMPLLENALPAAAAAFVPLALALRVSQRSMRVVSALTRRIPAHALPRGHLHRLRAARSEPRR